MEISRIGMNYIPITYGAKKAENGTAFLHDLEGSNKQYAPEAENAGKAESMSLTELYYRMRWGLTDEEEKERQSKNTPVKKAGAQEAGEGQADPEAGKVGKSQDGKNEGEEDKESKTDTDIIVKPDGSRVLVVTTTIGDMETTMSLEISKPTDLPDEASKGDGMDSLQRRQGDNG